MAFYDSNEISRPVTDQPAREVIDLECELDRALEGTFPASDPVSSLRVQSA